MDETTKAELLTQFGAFLEQLETTPALPPEEDAFSLVAELAGLKSELKRESRQVKEAVDQFKALFATLQTQNEALNRELEQRRAQEQTLRRELLRPLLLQLLELRDRLEAGLAVSLSEPGWWRRRQGEQLAALREGQTLSLRRLDRLLADYQVRPLEVLGKPLDPHTMRVVEVESRPGREQGLVTGELRKGFFWEDVLLRAAEVKVNKRNDSKADR